MAGYPRPISTVMTPASSHDMTDLATVKAELNITSVDATRDAVLSRYISDASQAVEQFTNRVFVVETIKDQFFPQRDGAPRIAIDGQDPLQLSRFPIASISSIVENSVPLVEATDFIDDAQPGQLIRLDAEGFPRSWRSLPIVVTYSAGFSTIPSVIVAAVIRTVAQRFFARGRDPMLRSESVPGVWEASYWVAAGTNAGAEGNLSPDVQSMIDNYRVPVIG